MMGDTKPGRQFGEFIMQVTKGEFDGTVGRSRLMEQTDRSVDAGELTMEGQALILREWTHPRRQAPARGGEEEAGEAEEQA